MEKKKEVPWVRDTCRLLDTEVRKVKKTWRYTNEGEAFVHVFIRSYFNLEDEDAADDCQVGWSGHDKGIDAFHADESAGIVYIVGGTYESKSFGPEILTCIRRAFEFLHLPSPGEVKRDLATTWNSYQELRSKGLPVVYILVTFGNLNSEAKKEVEKLNMELEKRSWTIEIVEKDEVLIRASAPSYALAKGPDVEFRLEARPLVFEPLGLPKYAIFFVNGGELVKTVEKNGLSVFALNLREYLGPRNPVNRAIEESLKSDERKYFPYLNLGVDAICDEFDTSKFPHLDIKNFHIVNGCQTVMSLTRFPTLARECQLMLRLAATMDETLALDIAVAKNKQTAIKDRELFAHDKIQLLLAEKTERLWKPFFYERRRGEWTLRKNKPTIRRQFGERVICNDMAAKAYLATLLQEPFEAKHKARFIFRSREEGGIYQKVFREDLEPEDLIIADEIFQVALEERSRYAREYNQLTKKDTSLGLTEEERERARSLSYLVHADTYLAALVWYFCDKYIKDKEKIKKFLITFDRPISASKKQKLRKLCKIASKIITQHLDQEETVYAQKGIAFVARNFFARTEAYNALKKTADRWVESNDVLTAIS